MCEKYVLLLDILHIWECLAHIIKNHRFAGLTTRLRHLIEDVTYVTWHDKWARALYRWYFRKKRIFLHVFKSISSRWCLNLTVRTGIQWTTLFCVYFVMCGLIVQWPSKFNTSIHRLIGDIFFVTKCIVKWAVIWWNLSSFGHLHFLIYPKCTFVRITAFSLLSMNNYTVL